MFFSLKNRLISFIVVLFALSFGALSVLLFNEARTIIRSYIESSALEKMEEYGSYVDMVQLQIYDAASLVFNSDITKGWDNALKDKQLPDGERMLANLSMSRFLTQASNSYSSISDISIYRKDGLRVGGENQVTEDPSYLEEPWFENFFSRGERWLPVHNNTYEMIRGNGPVISLLMPVNTFHYAASDSVMKINVSESYFLEPLSRIHLASSSTIYLLNEQGQPLLSQQSGQLGENAVNQISQLGDDHKAGVIYLTNSQGQQDILVYKRLARTGWMLAGVAPEKELYASLYHLRNTIIAVTILLSIVGIVAAAWLAHGITKPLTGLVLAMRQVQRGAFDSAETLLPPDGNVRSEINYAVSTFRYMILQLRQHIQKEFELKLLRQQAEYKAMLMQINPHFMFNTLELISSLAMQRRTVDTVDVIESLGKMLRFNLHLNDDRILLKEELEYVRHYNSILQTRFGSRLQLSVTEKGSLESVVIIKFLLQPLIENAVKYSFQHQTEAVVEVNIRRHERKLYLTISDNGPGFQQDTLEQLYDASISSQLDPILNNRSWHIGLGNVLARCRLYYGELFQVHITNRQGGGARVELILPAQEEKRHELQGIDS